MNEQRHDTLAYVAGFVLSLGLTYGAYVAVTQQLLAGSALIAVIASLAIVQLFVQLYFFLHLGQETKPRWKLLVFGFMVLVLVILVFGSLWVMQHLNYNMMRGHDLDHSIMQDEGIR